MSTFSTAARRVAVVVAVSALSITAIAGPAGPASAEAAAFADARGDISQGADIRKVRVVNGEERLRVDVRRRDLVRSFRSGSSIAVMRLDYADDVARISIDQVVLENPGTVRVEVKTGAEQLPEGGAEPTREVDWLGTGRSFTPWVQQG